MESRRGVIFFWIAQVLLLPTWICFGITAFMRFVERTLTLWQIGVVFGLVQVPFAALALIFLIAADFGNLIPKPRLRAMYLETTFAAVLITLVFLWRAVYRW